MTSMTDALIARGQEAVKSLASSSGQAVRDNLLEAGRGLMAARQKIPLDQDFSTWLHSSVYSFVVEDERAALIKLGEYETELRPLIEGSTHTSAQVIWQQFKDAAEAMRITASSLSGYGLVDEGLEEPLGGAHRNPDRMAERIRVALIRSLDEFDQISIEQLLEKRQRRLAGFGEYKEV